MSPFRFNVSQSVKHGSDQLDLGTGGNSDRGGDTLFLCMGDGSGYSDGVERIEW